MMKRAVPVIAAALALAPIWGSTQASAARPNGGSISIETKAAGGGPLTQAFVNAAGQALAARGFTVLEGSGHAAYAAELIVSQIEVGTGSAKAPAGSEAATTGGAFGGVGAGVTIPLSTGRSELVPLQRTRLQLSIRKRGEEGVLWHGAAVTVRAAGTRRGTDEKVAADLSEALLGSYPAEPEDVIGVP